MIFIENNIEINQGILMGKPVIKGTRIPVESLLEKLSAGETENDIIKAHPHITKDNIKAALAFAAQSLKGENIYPVAL
jgi:uncharacterized protein (DUF433 family)